MDDTPLPDIVVQAVSSEPGNTRAGLLGEYYIMKGLMSFPSQYGSAAMRRADDRLSFPLADGSVGGAQMGLGFYARWSGKLRIAATGDYTFHLQANDEARLSLDGSVVTGTKARLTGSTPLADTETSGEVSLTTGEHEILVEYYNRIGRQGLELAWMRCSPKFVRLFPLPDHLHRSTPCRTFSSSKTTN